MSFPCVTRDFFSDFTKFFFDIHSLLHSATNVRKKTASLNEQPTKFFLTRLTFASGTQCQKKITRQTHSAGNFFLNTTCHSEKTAIFGGISESMLEKIMCNAELVSASHSMCIFAIKKKFRNKFANDRKSVTFKPTIKNDTFCKVYFFILTRFSQKTKCHY